MSYRWVMKYLPDDCKVRPGIGGPSRASWIDKSKVALHATSVNGLLVSNSVRRLVSIRNYRNTGFVNVLLEKDFYDILIKSCTMLDISLEAVINNAMILVLKELESAVRAQENGKIFSLNSG